MALRRPSSLLLLRRCFSSLRFPPSPPPMPRMSFPVTLTPARDRHPWAAAAVAQEPLRNLLLSMLNPSRSLASSLTASPGGRRNVAAAVSEEDDDGYSDGGSSFGSSDYDDDDEDGDIATGEEEGFDSDEDFGSEDEDFESEEDDDDEEEAQQTPLKRTSKGSSSR